MSRLYDLYPSFTVFESTLEDARMSAQTDWEERFVAETSIKYDQYGTSMYWSREQDNLLRRIAGPDD